MARQEAGEGAGYRVQASERGRPVEPLDVGIGVASDSQFYADLVGNLVGVFASTFVVLAKDSAVELIVTLPDGRSFRAQGVVQFVRQAEQDQLPGLGVAFTAIDPSDHAAAVAFCTYVRGAMLYDDG
jgi:hypothetical protein